MIEFMSTAMLLLYKIYIRRSGGSSYIIFRKPEDRNDLMEEAVKLHNMAVEGDYEAAALI